MAGQDSKVEGGGEWEEVARGLCHQLQRLAEVQKAAQPNAGAGGGAGSVGILKCQWQAQQASVRRRRPG